MKLPLMPRRSAPLCESGVAVELEVFTGVEVALQIDVVVNRRLNGGEFL
jgi:hypothetical protein